MDVMTLDVMAHPQAERADRAAQRVQAHRAELVERIARAVRADGTIQPLHGLYRFSARKPLGFSQGMNGLLALPLLVLVRE